MRAVSFSRCSIGPCSISSSRAIIASAIAIALTGVSSAIGAPASAIIRQGDDIGGGVTVSNIDSPASNGKGGYLFSTTNSDSLSRFFGNATGGARALLRTEGTFGTFTQTAFEFSYGFADSGAISYSPTVNDSAGPFTGLDGVWLDNTKVLQERDPMPTGLPGQFSVFGSDPQITYDGIPYWTGGYGATQGGSTQNRALFKGTNATPIIKGGDAITNAGGAIISTGGGPGFGERFSAAGTNYVIAPVMGGATTATDAAVVVNGGLLAAGGGFVREGSPVPAVVGGLAGENWANFDALAINESGDAFFTGDTSAATTTDEIVFSKGSIAMREGALVPTPLGNGTVSGDIEWGDSNENNDWAATWDVTVAAVNREALIVNGDVVLIEGQLVDWNGDGVIDAGDNNGKVADFTGIRAVTVGERDGFNSFFDVFVTIDIDFLGTVSATDDLEGGFRVRVDVPEPASITVIGIGAVAMLRRRRQR